MRPVNLIPPEERGDKAPVRTGPIAYLLVGALALGLAGVTMLVLESNKVSDRKAEIASLQQQEAEASQRAAALAPFAQFSSVEEQRKATIESLADSRFDWERVMRELGLILPADVWLTDLTGSVSGGAEGATAAPDAAAAAATGSSAISGPSLQLTGCAVGQEAVAGFLSALRDIDGVTRVGLTSSERPTDTGGAASGAPAAGDSAAPAGGQTECRTRDFITKFEIVVAFDEVPAPEVPGAAPATPPTAPAAAPAEPAAPAPATESTPASTTAP